MFLGIGGVEGLRVLRDWIFVFLILGFFGDGIRSVCTVGGVGILDTLVCLDFHGVGYTRAILGEDSGKTL